MEILTVNVVGKARRATVGGKSYLVAPLSLIVPGVLNGSKGSLYYPVEEISKNVSAWNNVPLVVNHPQSPDGTHRSAREPDVLAKQGIGSVKKAAVLKDGRLTAEGWFDEEACRRVDNRVLSALQQGKQIELSTGLYTDNEPAQNGAAYNGRTYTHTARNYRPDHVAILPDQIGACSLADGCGVLVNAEGEGWVTLDSGQHVYISDAGMHPSGPGTPAIGGKGGDKTPEKAPEKATEPPKPPPPKTHSVDSRYGPKGVKVGDKMEVSSRGGPGWVAKLGGKHPKYGRQREFLSKRTERSGMRGQIVTHHFEISEPGEYEVGGDEFGKFKHSFTVNQHSPFYEELTQNIEREVLVYNARWDQDKRDKLPDDDFAGPDKSYPIKSQADVDSAAKLIGHAEDPEAVKRKIIEIAKRKGLVVPEAWKTTDNTRGKGKKGGLLKQFIGWLVGNALPNQPRHGDTGRYLPPGSGTGKGPVHAAVAAGHAAAHGKPPEMDPDEEEEEEDEETEATTNAPADINDTPAKRAELMSDRADQHTRGAKDDDTHKAAMEAHQEAADAHREAAQSTDDPSAQTDHNARANYHDMRAKEHEAKCGEMTGNQATNRKPETEVTNMGYTPEKRKELIDGLVANCACQAANVFNEADRSFLEKQTDQRLDQFTAQRKATQEAEQTLTANRQAQAAQAKPPATEAEWFASAPERVRSAVHNAMLIEQRERMGLVERLTVNVKDAEQKKALTAKLAGKPLDELKEMLLLLPAPTANAFPGILPPEAFSPSYLGAAVPPTINAADIPDDDSMDPPTLNYAELSAENNRRSAV